MTSRPSRKYSAAAALVLLSLSALPGCLVRTLTIETEPPGARVFMDRRELGTTPVTIDFQYGGKHEFLILHEEGEQLFRPVRVIRDVENYYYDTFPFDILADISPQRIEDHQVLTFELEPTRSSEALLHDSESFVSALLRRADDLKERARVIQEQAPPSVPPLIQPQPDPAQPAETTRPTPDS